MSKEKDDDTAGLSKKLKWIRGSYFFTFLMVLAIILIFVSFFTPAGIALGLFIGGCAIAGITLIGFTLQVFPKMLYYTDELSNLDEKLKAFQTLPNYMDNLLFVPETWNNAKIENVFTEIEMLAQTTGKEGITKILAEYGVLLTCIHNQMNNYRNGFQTLSQESLYRQIVFLRHLVLSLQNIFDRYPDIIAHEHFDIPENYFTSMLKQPLFISRFSNDEISHGILPIADMIDPVLKGLGHPKRLVNETLGILEEFLSKNLNDFIPSNLSQSEQNVILTNESLQTAFNQEKEKVANKVVALKEYLAQLELEKEKTTTTDSTPQPVFGPVLSAQNSLQKKVKNYFLNYWDMVLLEKDNELVYSCRNKSREQAQQLSQSLNKELGENTVSCKQGWFDDHPLLIVSSTKFRSILEIEKQHAQQVETVNISILPQNNDQPTTASKALETQLQPYFRDHLNLTLHHNKNGNLIKLFNYGEITKAKFFTYLINKEFGNVAQLIDTTKNGIFELQINQDFFKQMLEALNKKKNLRIN